MSPALLPVVVIAASALYAAGVALRNRYRPRPQPPTRTEADVLADAAKHRAARDLETCQAIWRITDIQHRLDRRKEEQ
ncbi:hypothetical protein [Streptomyces sp. NPDC059016]|uniref:hypothetical protein n=1 Tax=Streptomyces sp. NPDC059016 TaxID=3346699 RepID=UPI00367B1B98